MIDHSSMRLGKKPARQDHRTLRMARYLTPGLPPPPPSVDWTKGITSFGMMCNDSLGDCTIAACGHAIQVWTSNVGAEVTPPDPVIQSYYEKWDGYNPADPNTDQGGVELDVLNDWRQQGFDGHELLAYADADPQNDYHVKFAIALFGGLYIGINLPASAQNQDVWDAVDGPNGEPGSWGGHAVFVPKYETLADGTLQFTCITWGQLKRMTAAFWKKYVDEAHALLAQEWLAVCATDGFDLAAMQQDLQAVTG